MRDPINRLLARLSATPDAEVSDAELLARAAGGEDRVALELVIRRHAGLVWRVCLAVARRTDVAEDAFQATFLAFVRGCRAIRERSAAGWLHRVAYRAARRARERLPAGEVPDVPSGEIGPDEAAERAERAAAAHAALSRLPEAYRVPVVLCHLEGYTQAEAARQLGLPLGTVAVRVKRGLERLRKHLAGAPLALAVGAGWAGTAGAAPAPVVARACQIAFGTAVPEPAVVALAKAAVAGGGFTLGIATVVVTVAVAVGVAFAGPGSRESVPPAPVIPPEVSAAAPELIAVEPRPVPEAEPIFLAYPVTTDLQRALLGEEGEGVGTVVFVRRTAVTRGDGTPDPESPGLAAARAALAGDRFVKSRSILFYCPKVQPAARERRPDAAAGPLIRLGREVGFAGARFSHAPGTLADDWAAALRAAQEPRPAEAAERGVGAGDFVAYPVRTALSRLLTGGADCVVVPAGGRRPPDREAEGLAALRKVIDGLGLPARDTVLVLSGRRGDDRKHRHPPPRAAELLGFARLLTRPGPEPPEGHHGHHPPGGH